MEIGKRIASATLQLTLGNAMVRLLSLVTMPILTRLLSPEAYGTAAMVGTMISLVSVVALAGLDMSYMRAYPSKSAPSGRFVEIFVWRTGLGAGILAGVGAVAGWRLISNAFSLPGYLCGWVGAGIFLSMTNTMAQTRARLNNRYRAMALSAVASGLGAAVIAIAVAYWWWRDELPLILLMLAGYLIPVLILGIPPVAQLSKRSSLKLSDQQGILRIGIAGIVTAPAFWVLSSSDRWFLGYFEDAASVGIYSLGYSIAIMGMMVNSAVLSAWTPETAKEFEDDPEHASLHLGRMAERLVAGYGCIWLAITAAGGDVIRLLAPPVFHEAVSIVPYIAGAVFFYGITHLWNANLLVVKRLGYAMWWWIAGALICFLLNLAFVPWLGKLGAALTQTLSFAFVACGIVSGAQKICPLQIDWRRLGFVLAGVLVMGIGMYPAWTTTPAVSLLLKFPVGVLTVFVVLRFIAPGALLWVTRRLAIPWRRG